MAKKYIHDRLLFEKTVIGLALCRLNGELVDVNSAFAALLGRTIEETLQLSYWEITPTKFAAQEQRQLESLEKTGKYGPYEKEYIHVDRSMIPVRLSGQIVEIEGEHFIWSSVEDISDRKKAEFELARLYTEVEQLSLMDGLTGIANRRMIDQTLEREWEHAKRDQQPLSLILLDIDFFKEYNDYYGHLQGDECLKQVATALKGVTKRAIDLLGRYGGEEFLYILPETNNENAIQLAQQCLSTIREQNIPHLPTNIFDSITISAGVSTCIPVGEMQSSTLIGSADQWLYKAKRNGRNRLEYHEHAN